MNRIVSLFFILVLVGCSDPSNVNKNEGTPQIPGTFTLQNGQIVRVKTNSGNVDVKVVSVIESRCPSDGNCIWAGKVDVGFQFGDQERLILLCLPEETPGCRQETDVAYENKAFNLLVFELLLSN